MELNIHVKNVHGSQMAAKITGTFDLDRKSFRFSAIAFGRIGGQNIGAKLSKATEKELLKLGYDVENVISEIQRKLIQGNMDIPEGLRRESFVDQ